LGIHTLPPSTNCVFTTGSLGGGGGGGREEGEEEPFEGEEDLIQLSFFLDEFTALKADMCLKKKRFPLFL
jgi:hypothetical protein